MAALTAVVLNCNEAVRHATEIVSAVRGLQGLDGKSAEVQDLLDALAPKVQSCTENLNLENIKSIVSGLGGLHYSQKMQHLLDVMGTRVAEGDEEARLALLSFQIEAAAQIEASADV